MEEILEYNCLKKKKLIKDVLDYYRNNNYPLYIYQVLYKGKVKHISCRVKDIKSFDLTNRDSYYQTTIQDKTGYITNESIRTIFSVNDFVADICSLNGPSDFIFPKIKSEYLDNLNMYQLCLDYKCTRDIIYYIKGSL